MLKGKYVYKFIGFRFNFIVVTDDVTWFPIEGMISQDIPKQNVIR